MFKLVDESRAWWPVVWPGVTEDGAVVENRIEMQFTLLDTDANLELEAEAARLDQQLKERRIELTLGSAEGPAPSQLCADVLLRIARDWRNVGAANGEALPFTSENVARLMKVTGVLEACLRAYRDCLRGKSEIREGN